MSLFPCNIYIYIFFYFFFVPFPLSLCIESYVVRSFLPDGVFSTL